MRNLKIKNFEVMAAELGAVGSDGHFQYALDFPERLYISKQLQSPTEFKMEWNDTLGWRHWPIAKFKESVITLVEERLPFWNI